MDFDKQANHNLINFVSKKSIVIGENRAVERGGEAVIFTGAQTSRGGPRERNLPLFKSYFKILPGPLSNSIILSTTLGEKCRIEHNNIFNCFNSQIEFLCMANWNISFIFIKNIFCNPKQFILCSFFNNLLLKANKYISEII